MPGQHTHNHTKIPLTDTVMDHLLCADGDTMSVAALSSALGGPNSVPDSVLASALRALSISGDIETRGSSRRRPGLPLFVSVARDPGHNRRVWAARRVGAPPPQPPPRNRPSRAKPRSEWKERKPRRRSQRKPRSSMPPRPGRVAMPVISTRAASDGRRRLQEFLDSIGRGARTSRAVAILLHLGSGEYRTSREVGEGVGCNRRQSWGLLDLMTDAGLVKTAGPSHYPYYALTDIGFGTLLAAAAYDAAPDVSLSVLDVNVLRTFMRPGDVTAPIVSKALNCGRNTPYAPLRRLARLGLVELVRGAGMRWDPHRYRLTDKGHRVLACI